MSRCSISDGDEAKNAQDASGRAGNVYSGLVWHRRIGALQEREQTAESLAGKPRQFASDSTGCRACLPTAYGPAPTAESIDGIDVQAIVVEPSRDAPDSVRRIAQEGKLCVMFYGPAANKVTLAFPHLLTQKESARALCTPLCHAMKAK